jgi:hypothetical protein
MTMWATVCGNGMTDGDGLRVIVVDEARERMEDAACADARRPRRRAQGRRRLNQVE